MVRNVCKEVSLVCAPLFLESKFLRAGHTQETTNATITFIKYQDILYLVTCRHVVDGIKHLDTRELDAVPRIDFGRGVSLDIARMYARMNDIHNPVFCPDFIAPKDIDIALKGIPLDDFKLLSHSKEKSYIDLDSFKKPPKEKIKYLAVFGWLDEHKTKTETYVQTPMVSAVVQLRSEFDTAHEIFRLYSEFDKPHGLHFSGVSGGPVFFYDEADDELYPVGIVFGGSPGSARNSSPDNLVPPNAMFFEGFYLTPEIFENWINAAKPINEIDPSYTGFIPIDKVLSALKNK